MAEGINFVKENQPTKFYLLLCDKSKIKLFRNKGFQNKCPQAKWFQNKNVDKLHKGIQNNLFTS